MKVRKMVENKTYKELLDEIKSIEIIEFKKPIPKNDVEKDLLRRLEISNCFSDCFKVYVDLQKQIVTQDEYKTAIFKYYAGITNSKKLGYQNISKYLSMYCKEFTADEIKNHNLLFIDFFKHRVLYRNIKGYLMQEIYKIAILEQSLKCDKIEKLGLLESNLLDFGFAVDFVSKVRVNENLEIYSYLHITKHSFYKSNPISSKMAKTWIYAKDANGNKISFDRWEGSSDITLKYLDSYKHLDIKVVELTDDWNVPAEPAELVKDYFDIFDRPFKMRTQDYKSKTEGNTTIFESIILDTLLKFDDEILTLTTAY